MNVFYFSSDAFVSVMGTSIVSLLKNNGSFRDIVFYIVDDGISKQNKKILQELVKEYETKNYKRSIKYLPAINPEEALKYPFKSRYQMGHSYFRMCIGSLLPKSVNRVLCLDSDTLICGDLTDLWNMDLGDNIMAGVPDCINIKKYKNRFWIDEQNIYCNAGVFLVDLSKWRENNVENKIIDRIATQNGNVFFFEQTLMNWACAGKILKLPPEYNVYTLFWAFKYDNLIKWRKPISFFKEEEIEKAKNNPKIIHLTRNFYMMSRPWIKVCDHPITNEYRKYKNLTPWKRLDDDKRSILQIFKYKMWHAIPQSLLASLASVVYNDIRPKMIWRNEQ